MKLLEWACHLADSTVCRCMQWRRREYWRAALVLRAEKERATTEAVRVGLPASLSCISDILRIVLDDILLYVVELTIHTTDHVASLSQIHNHIYLMIISRG